MRTLLFVFILTLWSNCAFAQSSLALYTYEPSGEYPYGRLNPEAPLQTSDYEPLIGLSDCKSLTRDANGNMRKDSVDVIWRFKYIMNGLAVQDESLKADGKHTSSIRQYDQEAGKWYVTFFNSSAPSGSPATWEGGKKGNEIILFNEQKAPNGMDGFYKITFHDISEKGFNWVGEWIDKAETISYPTWYLFCKKRTQ